MAAEEVKVEEGIEEAIKEALEEANKNVAILSDNTTRWNNRDIGYYNGTTKLVDG